MTTGISTCPWPECGGRDRHHALRMSDEAREAVLDEVDAALSAMEQADAADPPASTYYWEALCIFRRWREEKAREVAHVG